MKAIIWSKDNCPQCIQAKKLLEYKQIDYVEHKIGDKYTKEQLLEAVPSARSVPQIFIDDNHIGGYAELRNLLGV